MKKVFVELISKDQSILDSLEGNDVFSISFESSEDALSDRNSILEELKSKNECFVDVLLKSNCVFKSESPDFIGRLIVIGKNSPIKNGSSLKLDLSPKRQLFPTTGKIINI